jgi:MFS family permease
VTVTRGFRVVAAALVVGLALSSAPSPLYPLYQAEGHLGPLTITVVFAAYGLGVLISLFTVGHVSDWIGRRRALLVALGLEAVAAALFSLSPALGVLLAARVLTGLGVGILTATATAYLVELNAAARPGRSGERGQVVAAGATLVGIGAGALVVGPLAELAPSPLVLPFVAFAVVLVAMAELVSTVPETVARASTWASYRPRRIAAPERQRLRFAGAAVSGFVALAVIAYFTSLGPSFLAGTLHHRSPILAGLAIFSCLGAAAAAQALLRRLPVARRLQIAFALLPAGLVLVIVAVDQQLLALYWAGSVLAGAGAGPLFEAALATAADIAPPDARAETIAGVLLAAYVGSVLPILGLGLATELTSARGATLAFGVAMLALVVLGAWWLLRPSPARRR